MVRLSSKISGSTNSHPICKVEDSMWKKLGWNTKSCSSCSPSTACIQHTVSVFCRPLTAGWWNQTSNSKVWCPSATSVSVLLTVYCFISTLFTVGLIISMFDLFEGCWGKPTNFPDVLLQSRQASSVAFTRRAQPAPPHTHTHSPHVHLQSRWHRLHPQDGWLSECNILNLLPLSGVFIWILLPAVWRKGGEFSWTAPTGV